MSSISVLALAQSVLLLLLQIQLIPARVFERCELAAQLQHRYGLPAAQVATLVCIAQHSSDLNTAAFGGGSGPGGGSHGIFQISDVYWCSPPGQGAGCGLNCARLRDDDIADDVLCVRKIYAEHQRISGDGFTAWQAYGSYCRQDAASYVAGCGLAEDHHGASSYQHQQQHQHHLQPQYVAQVQHVQQVSYPASTKGKIYSRCELAQELYYQHKLPMQQIPTWVCIAQHESSYNTAAVGRLNADGSADHGLFQISDLFWCTHDQRGGKGCHASCNQFLDSSIADDVQCIRKIHQEHTQISGDGFTAWTVYNRDCRNQRYEQVAACFTKPQPTQVTHTHPNAIGPVGKVSYAYPFGQTTAAPPSYSPAQTVSSYQGNPFLRPHPNAIGQSLKPQYAGSSPANPLIYYKQHTIHKQQQQVHYQQQQQQQHYYTTPKRAGKVYTRCELAQELYFSHKFPMQDLATWVCIAEHESRLDTSAVGRLNADGSADHGLFQISDLYWCGSGGGKGCHIDCNRLLDSDISDDVQCIRTIHEEHTRLSGDGFTAWTVYNGHCRDRSPAEIASCFEGQVLPVQKPSKKIESKPKAKGKIYQRCELAQELYNKHKIPMHEIPTWVCIAQHESSFNTAAVGRLNTDGSEDHGLFQISDLYWCGSGGGKGCHIDCNRFLDSDISDDVQCIRTIHEEHTRLSGDGFTAWTVYKGHCRDRSTAEIASCFEGQVLPVQKPSKKIESKPKAKGKIYQRCELAQELYNKHKIPMHEIPTWVCIAQHESSFNTAAVGRLNTDGSEDHGLFQISDLYWCGSGGGKGCHIDCNRLLDSDISDDVQCIRTIHEEHTRLSGDGFTAWTVYNGHCRDRSTAEIASCFEGQVLPVEKPLKKIESKPKAKGKIYQRCELAQELYNKHKIPMHEIPTWVCIAQHESSFNTAAVGRLNTDGSEDHGLFQISDLYWCSHEKEVQGGKACHIDCDRLLDSDISDDVQCIRTIHEEHTRISGDGFTAWTVYNGHCRHQSLAQLSDCFDGNEIAEAKFEKPVKASHYEEHPQVPTAGQQGYAANPFLKHIASSQAAQAPAQAIKTTIKPAGHINAIPNHPFGSNPFLQRLKPLLEHPAMLTESASAPKSSYSQNPFINPSKPPTANTIQATATKPSHSLNYNSNPFLNALNKPTLVPAIGKPPITSTPRPSVSSQGTHRPYINSDIFRNEIIKFTATSSETTTTNHLRQSQPPTTRANIPITKPTVKTNTRPANVHFTTTTHWPNTKPSSTLPKVTSISSYQPTIRPTTQPTARPTSRPTSRATTQPTTRSTTRAIAVPTTRPTTAPTARPTTRTTSQTTVRTTTQKPLTYWTPNHPTTTIFPKTLSTKITPALPTNRSTPRTTSHGIIIPTTRPTTRATTTMPTTTTRPTTRVTTPTTTRFFTNFPTTTSTARPITTPTTRPTTRATSRIPTTRATTPTTTTRPFTHIPTTKSTTRPVTTPTTRLTTRPTTRATSKIPTTTRPTIRATTSTTTTRPITHFQTTKSTARLVTTPTTRPTTRATSKIPTTTHPTTRATTRTSTPRPFTHFKTTKPTTPVTTPTTRSTKVTLTTRSTTRFTTQPTTKSTTPSTTKWRQFTTKWPSTTPKTTSNNTKAPTASKPVSIPTNQRPQSSTTPRPYLFTSTTVKSRTTTDPFSHPFFAKFNAKFDKFSTTPSTTIKSTPTNQTTSRSTASPYYSKFQDNNANVSSKTVYSYSLGQQKSYSL